MGETTGSDAWPGGIAAITLFVEDLVPDHWRSRAARTCRRSGIDEAAVLIDIGAVLEGNAPGVPFRIAKTEAVSPTRPRRLRVEIEDVVESAYLVIGSVDHLLGFAVDRQRETAERISCPPKPPFQDRLGEETQHDAV